MIDFSYQTSFQLERSRDVAEWISEVIKREEFVEGEISYVFCDDAYLLSINKKFLDHDTLTDIISFDYSLGKEINGEIYISVERVGENATIYKTDFKDELHRVIIHGILHYCGYKDNKATHSKVMRSKEEEALGLRTFC